MAISKKHAKVVKDIQKKYGDTIDLKRSPGVMIEVLRNYGYVFSGADDPPGGTGTGGTGTGGTGTGGTGTGGTNTVSSIAGSGPPSEGIDNSVLLRALVNLQKDVKNITKQLNAGGTTRRS